MHTLTAQQDRDSFSAKLDRIIPFGARASWPEGFQVYEEGTAADGLFILLSGRVVLRNRLKGGRGFIPAVINRGMTFGFEGLAAQARFLSDAVASQRSETLHLTTARFRALMRECPTEGINLIQQIAEERGQLMQKLHELAAMNVEQRLVSSLRRLSDDDAKRRADGLLHLDPADHRLLCEMVGATRESIGLALNRLVSSGAAERRGSSFLIARAALEQNH
jgi:CRP/FNR family transcriptional regulator